MGKDLYSSLKADLKRVREDISFGNFLSAILFNHSFKYLFWFRIGNYSRQYAILKPVLIIALIFLRRLNHKYGIQLSIGTNVGKGLFFPHYSSIVVSADSIIGEHVTLFNGVTIGTERGGDKQGAPTIGNNVVVATGAKVIGGIVVGNNVFIGANAVVVKDVPDNAVIGGIPAKILNMNGLDKTSFY